MAVWFRVCNRTGKAPEAGKDQVGPKCGKLAPPVAGVLLTLESEAWRSSQLPSKPAELAEAVPRRSLRGVHDV